MSQLTSPLRHPVVACVRLTRLVDRVEGLRLRVTASAMDVADVEGAPTVAAWLAPRIRTTTRSLHGREQLARGLDPRWQLVGDGVVAGPCRWRRRR